MVDIFLAKKTAHYSHALKPQNTERYALFKKKK